MRTPARVIRLTGQSTYEIIGEPRHCQPKTQPLGRGGRATGGRLIAMLPKRAALGEEQLVEACPLPARRVGRLIAVEESRNREKSQALGIEESRNREKSRG